MKSVNFQRNKSLLRVVNEEQIKKRRNYDRIIYLTLLIAFLIFLFYFFIFKSLYLKAYGQVIIDSMRIRLTDDSRIAKYYVNEGDSVVVGDTLFAYALDEDIGDGDGGGGGIGSSMVSIADGGGNDKDTWYLKEIYNLKKKIALNNIEMAENKMLMDSYSKEIKRLSNEVVLDVLPKTRLEYVQNEILRLNTENQKLNSENNQLNALIGTLGPFRTDPDKMRKINVSSSGSKYGGGSGIGNRGKYGKNKQVVLDPKHLRKGNNYWEDYYPGFNEHLSFSGEDLSQERYFLSPMDGIITREYIHVYETALKSEDILSIHRDHPAFIKAFFSQEDLLDIKEGDEFKIKFPDGTVSHGILKRFYIATYVLPDEFQKRYEPVTRSIAADIYPVDPEEAEKWKNFYKMGVEIYKFKY